MKKGQRDDLIQWRRAQVIQLLGRGKNLTQIAEILRVDLSTISRDQRFIEENSRAILQDMSEKIAFEFVKSLARLNAISDEAWLIAERAANDKSKVAALSLAQQAAMNIVKLLKEDKLLTEGLGNFDRADLPFAAASKTAKQAGAVDSEESQRDRIF